MLGPERFGLPALRSPKITGFQLNPETIWVDIQLKMPWALDRTWDRLLPEYEQS
jgi:hypothetical protein